MIRSGEPVDVTLEDAVQAVHMRMSEAVKTEDWEELRELDRQARSLIESAFGTQPVPLRDDSGTALRHALEALAEFYASSLRDLEGQRSEVARQIREIKSGRKGISAYETTRRHSMRIGPGHPED